MKTEARTRKFGVISTNTEDSHSHSIIVTLSAISVRFNKKKKLIYNGFFFHIFPQYSDIWVTIIDKNSVSAEHFHKAANSSGLMRNNWVVF